MEELLKKVSELIDNATNIPIEIKPIVKAVCRGYIRESNGMIPLDGIMNVCQAEFIMEDENDRDFAGSVSRFGCTDTNYDNNCNVIHKMHYVLSSDPIKLITILTHELGHVITESKPCKIDEQGIYRLIKRTADFSLNCCHDKDGEIAAIIQKDKDGNIVPSRYGFRMSDGFLESISTRIFASSEFRQELLNAGYDLKDYVHHDERIFSSRIYDEYKSCFELFDYIMGGALFNFACKTFNSNEELLNFINENKLHRIFRFVDESNDILWRLKKYETMEIDEEYYILYEQYQKAKANVIRLAKILQHEVYGKSLDDERFNELLKNYENGNVLKTISMKIK